MSDRRSTRTGARLRTAVAVAAAAVVMLPLASADAQDVPDPGTVTTVPTPTTPTDPPPSTTTTQPAPPTTEPPEPTTTTRPRTTTTTTRPTTATTDEPNPDAAMPGDDDYAYAPAPKSSSGSSGGTTTATSSPPTTRAGARPSSPSASGTGSAGAESAAAPGPAGQDELPLYHVSSYDPGQWAAPPLGPLQLLDDTWDFDSMLSSMPSLTGRPDDTERLATSLLGNLGSPGGQTPQELAVAAANRPLDEADKAPNLVGVAVAAVLLPLLIFWRFRRRPLPTWGTLGGHRINLPALRRTPASATKAIETAKPDLTPRRATPPAANAAAPTPSRTRKQPNAATAPKRAPRPKHDPGGRTS